MGLILGTLFFGVSVLAHHLQPFPSKSETLLSQLARAVYGGGPIYVVLQFSTAAILTLAANTAFADFPRLTSIIARDGYLPRYLATRGDRLVFSNGIIILAVIASALIVAFGGITNSLIPLYAVGVFTSFTLSQLSMVMQGMVINGVGSAATFVVLLIVAVTKFAKGAWVPIVVVPSIIVLFVAIHRDYARVSHALEVDPRQERPRRVDHTVVVLVGRVHLGVLQALDYAQSLRPDHLVALYISDDDEDREAMKAQWREFDIDVALDVKHSSYRELTGPVLEYPDGLDQRWHSDTVTVVVPEVVEGRWHEHLLHNQSALYLKGGLLSRKRTVVTSVPYHVDHDDGEGGTAPHGPGRGGGRSGSPSRRSRLGSPAGGS